MEGAARRGEALRRGDAQRRGEPLRRGDAQRRGEPLRRGDARTQLTARGALVGLFGLWWLAMLLADWTGWRAVSDLGLVAGCGLTARYTRRGGLLALAVSGPVTYFTACLCAELMTANGTFGALTGIFVTLGRSAPWLFLGTALTLAVGVSRGLSGEVADLVADIRGR